jgi:hypothetical protein
MVDSLTVTIAFLSLLFTGWAAIAAARATRAMLEANQLMRNAEDARLVFSFPDGAIDPEGAFLLDMVVTNVGRSAATVHTVTICGAPVFMETVFVVGQQTRLKQFAIVPASAERNLVLAVDQTTPMRGRFTTTMNYRVLAPKAYRKTWWALPVDNLTGALDPNRGKSADE